MSEPKHFSSVVPPAPERALTAVEEAKPSTQRVRQYRNRQKSSGAKQLGMVLTPSAQAALQIIMAAQDIRFVKSAVEHALHAQALLVCTTPEELHALLANERIEPQAYQAWLRVLHSTPKF